MREENSFNNNQLHTRCICFFDVLRFLFFPSIELLMLLTEFNLLWLSWLLLADEHRSSSTLFVRLPSTIDFSPLFFFTVDDDDEQLFDESCAWHVTECTFDTDTDGTWCLLSSFIQHGVTCSNTSLTQVFFTFDEAAGHDERSRWVENIVEISDGTLVPVAESVPLAMSLTHVDRSTGVHDDDLQQDTLAHDDRHDDEEEEDAIKVATGGDVTSPGRLDFSFIFLFNQFTCELCCFKINAAAAINSLAFISDKSDAVSNLATEELWGDAGDDEQDEDDEEEDDENEQEDNDDDAAGTLGSSWNLKQLLPWDECLLLFRLIFFPSLLDWRVVVILDDDEHACCCWWDLILDRFLTRLPSPSNTTRSLPLGKYFILDDDDLSSRLCSVKHDALFNWKSFSLTLIVLLPVDVSLESL